MALDRRLAIGCLGGRDLPPEAAVACRAVGAELAGSGFAVVTGATPGEPRRDLWASWAAGAFAYGAARIDPSALTVCLPWPHFPRGSSTPDPGITVCYPEQHPEWIASAAAFWSATHREEIGDWATAFPRAVRLRHTRNVGLILRSDMVLAWPGTDDEMTPFALEFAAWRSSPHLDLSRTTWWTVVATLVERMGDLPASRTRPR
jgi:hypothetical protein